MTRSVASLLAPLLLLLLGASPVPAVAQRPVTPDPQLELRIGTAVSPDPGPFAGVGVNIRAGWYARLGIAAEAGATRSARGWQGSQRLEGTARFLLDPFGERPVGWYGGAGLGVRRVGDSAPRSSLVLLLGAEARIRPGRSGPLVPAIEVALGDGVHATIVWRRGRADSR